MEIYHKHPGLLLRRINRMHRTIVDSRLRQAGMPNRSQSHILMFLARDDGPLPSQKALAENAGITPAGVTSALRTLEAQGFITKESSPEDNRRKRVAVTEKGRAHLKKWKHSMLEVSDALFEGFSGEEIAVIEGYFSRMCKNLEKMGATPPEEPRCKLD